MPPFGGAVGAATSSVRLAAGRGHGGRLSGVHAGGRRARMVEGLALAGGWLEFLGLLTALAYFLLRTPR
jgi:hypothetical protein